VKREREMRGIEMHVAERAGFSSTRQFRRVWRHLHETTPRSERQSAE